RKPSTHPLRLELGRVGVSRAGHGLFWVGICLCAGVAVIGAAMLIFPHVGSTIKGVYVPPTHKPLPWPAWALISAFAVVGVGVTVSGINIGIRRAVVEVRGDTLLIDQTDLFGTRRFELRVDDIAAVDAGATGLSVGGTKRRGGVSRSGVPGRTIDALYICLSSGRAIRLLMGRDGRELDAIAARLRAALGCGRNAAERLH
ncbi:MAG: hypothetical protein QOF78_1959, partial [Phycisphaerales bacterium]|nr:hypothetical protein [Phycisphaerales bacterium]